jgi:replicative DNA helicase
MSDHARFQAVADLLDDWRGDVLSGKPPVLYPFGEGDLARIEIGPGLVTIFGGAPGSGKSALVMQAVCDALAGSPGLKALVCNVEMMPATLLDRQLARLSGIDLSMIRHRKLGPEHGAKLASGLDALEHVADRLAFIRPPFDLANVAASADAFEAELLVLDYIQRIAPPGSHGDRRGAVDASMTYLRQFADAGTAVVVVAALARQKDAKGRSSYSGDALSLASFRETSELEYGADSALILAPDDEDDGAPLARVVLKYLKNRHGETRDIPLLFDRAHQRFTPAEPSTAKGKPSKAEAGKLQAALRSAWSSTSPADEDDDA